MSNDQGHHQRPSDRQHVVQNAVMAPGGMANVPNPVNLVNQYGQMYGNYSNYSNFSSGRTTPVVPGIPPMDDQSLQQPPLQPPAPEAPAETPKQQRNKGKANLKEKAKSKSSGTKIVKGGGASQYTKAETMILLEAVREYEPIGQIAWKSVANAFNRQVTEERERDSRSLRNKFNSLVSAKEPTGDPNIPQPILMAKEINQKITVAADMVDAEEMESEHGTESDDDMVVLPASRIASEDETEDSGLATGVATLKTTASSSSVSTSVSERRLKRQQKGGGDSKDFLSIFLQTEAMHQKQERKRQKRQEKMERKREKREDKRYKMLFGLVSTAIVSFSGNREAAAGIQNAFINSSASSSSESSVSSINTDDSGPTIRAKIRKGKKHKKKTKTTGEEYGVV